MAIQVKNKLGYDDSLDAFGIHGVGGIIGALLPDFLHPPILDGRKPQLQHGGIMDSLESIWCTGSGCCYCNSFCSSNDFHNNIFSE